MGNSVRQIDKFMEKFVREIFKLEPEEYLGVLTLCGIGLFKDEEEKEEKDFSQTYLELLDKVSSYPRARRRNLMRIIKKANKGRK